MPYCVNCGSLINAGENFCRECGTPFGKFDNTNRSSFAQQGNIRKENINELNKMISYFGKVQSLYDEYDVCCNNIEYLSKPNTRIRIQQDDGSTYKILGIVGMVGSIPLSLIVSFMIGGLLESTNLSGSAILDINLAIGFGLFFLVGLTGLIFLIVGITQSGTYGSEMRKQKKIQIQQNAYRRNEIYQELMNHYRAYGYCAVSAEYTNPQIISAIRDVVLSGRADTIKEAINIMAQDAHFSEMEMQAAMTARSAASAARGAKAAAFFSAASFVSNLRK